MTSIQKLKEWIRKDELENAISEIKGLFISPFENDINLLERRYNAWKRVKLNGTPLEVENRIIRNAFHDLVDDLAEVGEEGGSGLTLTKIVPISSHDLIKDILGKLNKAITFRSPKQDAVVKEKTINAHGKILLTIPKEYSLWMIQKYKGFYYHANGPIDSDFTNGRWSQEKMRFEISGKYEMILCLVSEKGINLLNAKIAKGGCFGLSSLPRGIYPIKSISIIKE